MWYKCWTFKNPIFSSHFYSGVCWLLSSTFDSLFSTSEQLYCLLSPSLPNPILWIFVGVWATENTLRTDKCVERADFYNDKRSLPSSLIYDTQVTSKKMEEVLNSDNLNFNDKNYFWNKEGWQYYNLTYRLWLWLLYHHLLWTLLLIFQFMRHLWNTMLEPRLSWFQGDSQPTGGLRYLSAPRSIEISF